LLRQPADGADRRADRRHGRREPEHDVPAVAPARGQGPGGGQLGASRAPLEALLPDHGRGPGRVRAPERGDRPAAGPHRRLDRGDPERGTLPALMGRVSASIQVPGRAADAEALWYDPMRWAAWPDGFAHASQVPDEWPAGGTLLWSSRPGGRGRVLEEVVAYEARTGQTLRVEDERLRGTQRIEFRPASNHVTIRMSLDYELKQRHAFTPFVDRFFIRRELTSS